MNNEMLSKRWDEEADVLVVGSGFAGLAAAIEAKTAGCSIIILEKMKGYGGNSIISDGVLAAAGTSMQEKAGIQDSPQRMYEDMLNSGLGLNHPELVKVVTENSNEVLQWTINYLGVKYKDRIDQFGGHSVPRCYTTYNRSGADIIKQMIAKVKELGMSVRTKMYLKNFIKNSEGRVCGISVHDGYVYPDVNSGISKTIKANKAVIIATGGFANDIDFRIIQDPRLTNAVGSTNKVSTTAEALKEALKIGAMAVHLSWIQRNPSTSPDEKMHGSGPDFAAYVVFPYGIIIDPTKGKRFVNELADRKTRADAILNVGQPCIGIADEKGIEKSKYSIDHCVKKGVVKKFEQINEIADHYKLPIQPLQDSIERYNIYVENGTDRAFNKPILSGTKPLTHPPYYCIRLWPKVHYTMGGVQINSKAQVINLNYMPIKGLYAAGEVTGGIHGACRLSNCAIIDCLVFGRIAGRNSAFEKINGVHP